MHVTCNKFSVFDVNPFSIEKIKKTEGVEVAVYKFAND